MNNSKNESYKYAIRQILALCLLVLFGVFQFVQFYHHHDNRSSKTVTAKSNKIDHKCVICDFVAKKQNSHLEHQETALPVAILLPISSEGFHYQTNWYAAYTILTDNKGPPALV
ncbi:MAG: hypothetical protein ACQUHE_15090 [Bacteroidia bacterium]